ncbi:unnamed protein product [Sphagnum troendelagicum]|uniref:CCD97-like C-terminal domain-containing protein n=1 Tax=Sphagnum troendelagicum TaxID=128251 RepID=A0ABP0TJY2_9BRYO
MEEEGIERMIERLCQLPDLYLPHSLAQRSEPMSQGEKQSHLRSLVRRDAAIFLERYGPSLNSGELQQFEVLQEDYEVGWHLKALKMVISPTQEEQQSRKVAVQNRRLAFMNRLIQDGEYFSEDAMRMRAPLLHHEYVGQFQDPASRGVAARPGERYSELLIRQAQEDSIQQQLHDERVAAGILVPENPQEDEEDEEDEEEEDTEEDEEVIPAIHDAETRETQTNRLDVGVESSSDLHEDELDRHVGSQVSREDDGTAPLVLSDAEIADKMEDFTRVMQEKFLSGGDSEHADYAQIDNDVTLDDDWMVEISRDAEEKYFEED